MIKVEIAKDTAKYMYGILTLFFSFFSAFAFFLSIVAFNFFLFFVASKNVFFKSNIEYSLFLEYFHFFVASKQYSIPVAIASPTAKSSIIEPIHIGIILPFPVKTLKFE